MVKGDYPVAAVAGLDDNPGVVDEREGKLWHEWAWGSEAAMTL